MHRLLRFRTGKEGSREAASCFRHENEVISNPCHWHAFPPSLRTLWELTQICPKQRLLGIAFTDKLDAPTFSRIATSSVRTLTPPNRPEPLNFFSHRLRKKEPFMPIK